MSQQSLISQVVTDLPPSGIREFFDLVATQSDVISLGVGEPDFPTPWKICDAAVEALRHGLTSYTSNYGLLQLREAIAQDIHHRYQVEYSPDNQILITAGVSEGMDLAMRAVLDPGDEVIIHEPCYVSYKPCVALAGGVPVVVATSAEHDFKLQPDAVQAAITARTRALVLSYPNNPTGATMTRSELTEVARIADKHDLLVIADEIYNQLTYEGRPTCFASLPQMKQRTLLLNGFSKAYAMTGWRVGYACGPATIIKAMMRIHSYTALCSSALAQYGALEALENCEAEMAEMIAQYDQRRRLFVAGLNDIGLPCFEPKGAFYAFPSIQHTGLSASEFCRALLMEEKVAAIPGPAFGECGAGHIRCTYATHIDQLKQALERMERFIAKLASDELSAQVKSVLAATRG